DHMGDAYPELISHRDFIDKMVQLEEKRFGSTLTVGLQKLDEVFSKTGARQTPDFVELARLYDTFGTPRDLIRVSLEERGVTLNEDQFHQDFDIALQKLQRPGDIEKTATRTKAKPVYADVAARVQSPFRGYETTQVVDAKVLSLIQTDQEVQS